jgi:hypothetical protein
MFASITVYRNNLHFDWLCNICREIPGCELTIDEPKISDDPDIRDYELYALDLSLDGGCCQEWPKCDFRERLVSSLREKFIILTEFGSVKCPRFPRAGNCGYQLCARP